MFLSRSIACNLRQEKDRSGFYAPLFDDESEQILLDAVLKRIIQALDIPASEPELDFGMALSNGHLYDRLRMIRLALADDSKERAALDHELENFDVTNNIYLVVYTDQFDLNAAIKKGCFEFCEGNCEDFIEKNFGKNQNYDDFKDKYFFGIELFNMSGFLDLYQPESFA